MLLLLEHRYMILRKTNVIHYAALIVPGGVLRHKFIFINSAAVACLAKVGEGAQDVIFHLFSKFSGSLEIFSCSKKKHFFFRFYIKLFLNLSSSKSGIVFLSFFQFIGCNQPFQATYCKRRNLFESKKYR